MSSKSRFEGLADAAVRCAPANCRRDKAALIAWLRDNENAVLEKLFTKENQRISRRTKILAYCVAAQRTAREANKLLYTHGEERLYARNLPDITIMYSLTLHHSASMLCELMAKVAPLMQNLPADDFFTRNGRFCCTVQRMEAYLDAERVLAEKMDGITVELLEGIDAVPGDDEEFLDMLKEKLPMFSASRACTRRVFVHFLCQWARSVIQRRDKNTLVIGTFEGEIETFFNNADIEPCPDKWPLDFYGLLTCVNNMYFGSLFSPHRAMALIADDAEAETELKKCVGLLDDFLLGKSDISRTLFLAILAYFLRNTGDGRLDIRQLNAVLAECGWPPINGSNPFDRLMTDMAECQDFPKAAYEDVLKYDLDDPNAPVFTCYEGEHSTMTRSQSLANALRPR